MCTAQAAILKTTAEKQNILLHSYNIDTCKTNSTKYQITTTPTMIFSNKGKEQKIPIFLPKTAIRIIMCAMGGKCI